MKKAVDFLREAADVIDERAKLRDKQDGERSMERAVAAYTILRGQRMESELDGWLFMCVLKLARATAGSPHLDDYTDLAGYAALAAECLDLDKSFKTRKEALDELSKDGQDLGMWKSVDNRFTIDDLYEKVFGGRVVQQHKEEHK